MKCPNCGAQINDDSFFCTECGRPIPQGSVCPHCGASVNEGDVFCQNCGRKVNDSVSTEASETTRMKCPYCGASINDGDVFCENCGRNLADGSIGFIPNEVTPQSYESSSKKIIPIILGVLAVATVGVGLWYWSSSIKNEANLTTEKKNVTADTIKEVVDSLAIEMTPEEIVKKRVNYIYNEAPDSLDFTAHFLTKELYDLLQEDKDVTPRGCLGFVDYDIWSQSQGGDGYPSFTIKSAEILSEKKATAKITIKYSESSEFKDVKLVLIREGDDWYIDDFITNNGREQSLKQGLIDDIALMKEQPIEQYEELIDSVVAE